METPKEILEYINQLWKGKDTPGFGLDPVKFSTFAAGIERRAIEDPTLMGGESLTELLGIAE